MRPQIPKNIDREVHVQTEDASDEALLDVMAALRRRIVKIDRRFDIPYVAGYSRDGSVVFIDRHMPRSFTYWGKTVPTDRFLMTHEVVEKALLDQLRLHYLHAHQIAVRIEQQTVEAAGVSWRAYNRFTKKNEKKITDERLTKVPRTLDLTPYQDEHDYEKLKEIARAEA